MHGRKRSEYKAVQRDPKYAAGLAEKAEKWHTLNKELLQRRRDTSDVTLQLTEKLLLVNPDPLMLWNHRRDIIQATKLDIETELRVTQAALQNNPKAYGAWFHRKWSIVDYLLNDNASTEILDNELKLTESFLQRDERNFHCWNYRRFVVSCVMYGSSADGAWKYTPEGDDDEIVRVLMGAQVARDHSSSSPCSINDAVLQKEWDFSTRKIQDNFSNFSAFHYRSKLLPLMATTKNMEAFVSDELELVENAVFTEPDDQTAWWYHRFLLEYGHVHCGKEAWYTARLAQHLDTLQELSQEDNSKWVWLGILLVLERLNRSIEERKKILDKLVELDPDRRVRYQQMLSALEKTAQRK